MKQKAVILAGGQGSRFWPLSRIKRPKQFLPLGLGEESLLQSTVKRVEQLVGVGNVLVVASHEYAQEIKVHAPTVTIVEEPMAKNTAPCIGLAAALAAAEDPDTVLSIFPADHAIEGAEGFLETFRIASEVAAKEDVLVTVGIKPLRPNTGYGYIQRETKPFLGENTYRVKRFYEKPSIERAQQYVNSGDFFWNSGMFVWRAGTILNAFRSFLPDIAKGIDRIVSTCGQDAYAQVLHDEFAKMESVSIDLGILEHAKNVVVIAADSFSWNDVGSWDAWADQFPQDGELNVLSGNCVTVESKECVVRSGCDKRLIALVGLKDVLVIDTEDALLVCHRSKAQEVKKVVTALQKSNRTGWL